MSNKRGLWNNKDFMRFWIGQTVSQFGNQVTNLALPTIAILILHINVFQVGLLGAIEFLAFPSMGLFVGVWVDRYARKPILVICNLGRLVSLSTIPIAYLLGDLSIYQIFVVAGVNGVFTVFFDVAYQSYLPSLVDASDLVEGNSKLQTSVSAASVTGPPLAGILISLVGAAVSVALDTVGYLGSVLAMLSIRKVEPGPKEQGGAGRGLFWSELREGVNVILHTRVLSTLTGCITMANFGNTIAQSVFLFFMYDELHLTPLLVGIVGTSNGVAFLVGSLTASRVSRRLGTGKALTFSILSGFGWLGFPLALTLPALPTLILFSFLLSFPVLIFNITALSMMQRVTPSRLLGRMNATRRTSSWGVIPIGSFLGGILGETIGLPNTMIIGGLIAGGSVLWALLGPIYHLREESEAGSFDELKG